MIKEIILLIAFLGILALSLCGCALNRMIAGEFYFEPVNERNRPFTEFAYYPSYVIVNKQYQKIHIKEMSYEWEGKGKGNAGILLKDVVWDGPYAPDKERYLIHIEYNSLREEHRYRLSGIEYLIEDNVILAKFFKGKKRGDVFKYTVKVVYSFDDEPENTQTIEHNVTMMTGRFSGTLFRILSRIIVPLIAPLYQ